VNTELADPAVVGHKFARLESMRLAGLPVPPLFAVPVDAFDQAMTGVRLPAPDGTDVRSWSSAAASALAGLTVPPAVARQVLTRFDALVGPDGLAAVRACAVPAPDQPGEDDATDPFAGMTESFLYVRRADLLDRIVGCWASAYKSEAVLYRLRAGVDPRSTRIAVGVQRMVPGVRSFVVFTHDPRDGSAQYVIAAAHGIGEGVVQDRADTDHFFVTRNGAIHAETVTKRRQVGPPSADRPDELTVSDVPAELADVPVLDGDLVRRIVAVASRIERHFGGPQDIEGTVTADGAVHVVQARPMVLPTAGVRPNVVRWSNNNITESYPGVSSALTYSVARDFYRLIFTDLYRRMGVPERSLRVNAHHLARMVGMLDGRVFYRMDAWYALHGQVRAFPFIRGLWEHGMGLSTGLSGPPARPARWLRIAPGLLVRVARHPAAVRDLVRWWDDSAAAATARIDEAGPDELVRFYRRLWAQVGARWGVTLTNTMFTMLVTVVFDALLRRWAGQLDHRLMLGLLSGGRDNRSLAGLRSAIALAELIGRDPHLREQVLAAEEPDAARTLWADLVAGRYGPVVADAASTHLRRYGDRAPGDLKLEQPTPRQRPGMTLDVVRPMIRQGMTVAGNQAQERRTRHEAERTLRAVCAGPLRRSVLRGLADALRWFVKVREDTRFCRTELYGLSRRVLYRLGAALATAGHLDDADDVIDLTVEEVLGAFEGTLACADLRGLAALRRADRIRHATLPEPPTCQVTDADRALATPRPLVSDPGAGAVDVLRGLGSCAGVVRARARVVPGPDAPAERCQDHVLIARETDPGWLFLMTVAKGMVVERGTLLSHTAITGRLLGIPTVVAVPGATSRIPDGAWVEVDGSAGTVRLLSDEEAMA
jgi:rifampicin phosphotransferase